MLLTSLKDRTIDLHIEDGKVVGKGMLNGREGCYLERVFVQSKTSWGMPKVRSFFCTGFQNKRTRAYCEEGMLFIVIPCCLV